MPVSLQREFLILGLAYPGSYALHLIITLWLAHRKTGFMLKRGSLDIGTSQVWRDRAVLEYAVLIALFTLLRWRATEHQSGIEVGGHV